MEPRLLLVLSDLHCGSTVGLMPPNAKTAHGNAIGFGDNHHQAWLWQNWLDLHQWANRVVGNDPFALLLNGDLTEGLHHRTTEVTTLTLEEHARHAIECVSELAKAASKRFVTLGTECHTHSVENYIAQEIGAEGGKAKAKWLFRIAGTLVDATHHIGVTSRAYLEASQLSIAMGNAKQNAIRAGHEVPRIFLRGHRHCGGWYDDGESGIGVTGAWQFLTRHGHKVVPDSIPRPSALILDWRGCEDNSLPTIHRRYYTPPQPEIA